MHKVVRWRCCDLRDEIARHFGVRMVDVPLGETAEAYDLEILNGAAVVRTVSGLAAPSFLYTAAMMATDFGGPVSTLRLRAYQIGALGRGAAAEALV